MAVRHGSRPVHCSPLLNCSAVGLDGRHPSLYFGIYEVTGQMSRLVGHPEDSVRTVFVAGAATGMLTAPVTAPMQRLKSCSRFRAAPCATASLV